MIHWFEDYSLDTERRELRRSGNLISAEPQVFDLLQYLIGNRERVVSKEDLIAGVWGGRIVSDSTLSSRMTEVRQAIDDSGKAQRLIRTFPRKGFRFVGQLREGSSDSHDAASTDRPSDPYRPVSQIISPELRPLTIMICNMIGLPAAAARLDPEDLREVMDAYRRCVGEIARRFEGFIARAGDGVLVYFGYPQAHEDDAERAVRAGLALTRAVSELQLECIGPLRVHVGIATGLTLIGGPLAVGAATEHDAIGEAPYLAARLLALADPGTVVISPSTRRLLGHLFEYRELRTAYINGTENAVEAYRVLRESQTIGRYEALRPNSVELIGREEELGLLLRRWSQAKTGEGRVVLLWGEPGIGKSRLAAALQDAISSEHHVCLRFFCSPHRTQTALYPVASHLERAAGVEPGDGDNVKLSKLENLLSLSSQDARNDTALFAELLSIEPTGRYAARALSPQRRKELVLERFVAQLAGNASRLPVLMILEDAHWIDPTTRELFDILIERLRHMAVLLVMTYRPEFGPPWLGQSHVTMIALNRLTKRDSGIMIRAIAHGKDLPPRLLGEMIAHTDGVPLFIEEMTKSVMESDLLREEKGAYTFIEAHTLAVPATLQALLVERLDRLTSARTIVQTGAALGREFSYAVLQAVTDLRDDELEPLMDRLVSSELVHQRGIVPHASYTFKHALVQDAAYETLPKRNRGALQARIAEVLEQRFRDVPHRNPEVLARHCTEAALWEKAINYRLKAARMALDRSAGVEAHAHAEAAVQLLPNIADARMRQQLEGRLQVARGEAFVMTRGFASPGVIEALSRARVLLDKSSHTIEALRPLCVLFNYHMIRSETPKGLQLVEAFLKRPTHRSAAGSSDSVIQYLLGAAHLPMGNLKEAEFHLATALSLYDEERCRDIAFIGGYHIRSFTLTWLGLVRLYLGSIESAKETMVNAVKDARSRSHPFTLVSTVLAWARFLNHIGDLSEAIEATEEGRAIAAEHGSPYHLSRAGILRAVNLIDSCQPEDGIRLMERALIEHRETGANYQSSYNLSYLAWAYSQIGESDHALKLASQAVDEIERTGERWWQSGAYRMCGEILLATSDKNRDEAGVYLRRSLACALSQKAGFWAARAERSLARVAAERPPA